MALKVSRIERSGPAIRAALAERASDECKHFEADFRDALDRACSTFDTAEIGTVLDRWWGIAAIHANPLSDHEKTQIARARLGDFTGLHTREHGNWVQL